MKRRLDTEGDADVIWGRAIIGYFRKELSSLLDNMCVRIGDSESHILKGGRKA